eukprot:COSAG01_NODE_25463_length_744_cov_1.444961_1_plen_73_part_10
MSAQFDPGNNIFIVTLAGLPWHWREEHVGLVGAKQRGWILICWLARERATAGAACACRWAVLTDLCGGIAVVA